MLKTEGTNLLLITLDSFFFESLSRLKENGISNLDRFFSGGRLFINCTSQSPMTAPSHASIMTGLTLEHHGVYKNGDVLKTRTLAEILRQKGYDTAAAVGIWSLGSSKGFSRGFCIYHNYSVADPVLQVMAKNKMSKIFVVNTILKAVRLVKKIIGMNDEKSDRSTKRILKFFKGSPKKNFFCWLHFFDLHTNTEEDYWKGLRAIDRNIGKILAQLIRFDCCESTLIVITADHSLIFKDGKGMSGDDLTVPLVFYNKDIAPGESREQVKSVDIMPTVLHLLINDIPKTDGRVILRWKS